VGEREIPSGRSSGGSVERTVGAAAETVTVMTGTVVGWDGGLKVARSTVARSTVVVSTVVVNTAVVSTAVTTPA
jgi:hypothetical protein